MTKFADDLAVLCSRALADADAELIGEMIERLLSSAALTIGVSANGNAKVMQELLTGAEAYLYESASEQARKAAFIASIRQSKRRRA